MSSISLEIFARNTLDNSKYERCRVYDEAAPDKKMYRQVQQRVELPVGNKKSNVLE